MSGLAIKDPPTHTHTHKLGEKEGGKNVMLDRMDIMEYQSEGFCHSADCSFTS